MGRTGWIAAMALFAGMTGWTEATAETSDWLTIPVLVVDQVGVSAHTLRQALQETSRIFDGLGITLVWLAGEELPTGSVIIRIVATPLGRTSRNVHVMGIAARSKEARGHVATLFYHRIDDFGRLFRLDVSQMLGHVMAHEMGHLLLPYGSHAAAGLMKAGWDKQQALLAAMGNLTFEDNQAALIRGRLRNARETASNP
jgi:hypothetical protein